MTNQKASEDKKAIIFNVQRYSTEDGPGVRTTVFFKGCPLNCLWCSNPESKKHQPQLMHFNKTCVECYACLEACPNGANKKNDDGSVWVDRDLCKDCGTCVAVCPANARSIAGKPMTVDEVFSIIEKDANYYMNSDGGVTFGGGECTSQPEFLLALMEKCYNKGYHICLDTCALASWEVLEKMLPMVDMVLLDIKHLDPAKHKEYTGADNQLILDNAAKMKQMGKNIIVRLPLIPGHNDDEKNLKATGRFMKLWGLDKIDILPYHRFGVNKYDAIGEEYLAENIPPIDKNTINKAVQILESYGLTVNVM